MLQPQCVVCDILATSIIKIWDIFQISTGEIWKGGKVNNLSRIKCNTWILANLEVRPDFEENDLKESRQLIYWSVVFNGKNCSTFCIRCYEVAMEGFGQPYKILQGEWFSFFIASVSWELARYDILDSLIDMCKMNVMMCTHMHTFASSSVCFLWVGACILHVEVFVCMLVFIYIY